MFKKLSIRARITLLSACLLTLCCIGLTLVLSASAYRAIETIEATPLSPSMSAAGVETADLYMTPSLESALAKRGLRIESLLAMLGFIVLGSSLTYLVVGKSLQPLGILNEQIKNMNVSNLAEQLTIPSTHDEIAEITRSFNHMSRKLNDVFQTQKRFAASAAHELKTPLSVLQTKIDVFSKHDNPSIESYTSLVTVFKNQTLRLRDLVSSLLDLSHRDDSLEHHVELDVSDLMIEVSSDLASIADAKAVSITLDCDACLIVAEPDLIYRAFYNLVENAIKYNHVDGHITIVARALDDTHTRILIRDDGDGIDGALKDAIFEPFYRIDASRSRSEGGAGLGLAIVKEIIEHHHGTIRLLDTPDTCFEIIL